MASSWKQIGVITFGVFIGGLGYILVAESVLPGWAALAIIVGGGLGAIAGMNNAISFFGIVGQRVFIILLSVLFVVPLLVHSHEAQYAFMFGASLVVFSMLLQDVVMGLDNSSEK